MMREHERGLGFDWAEVYKNFHKKPFLLLNEIKITEKEMETAIHFGMGQLNPLPIACVMALAEKLLKKGYI